MLISCMQGTGSYIEHVYQYLKQMLMVYRELLFLSVVAMKMAVGLCRLLFRLMLCNWLPNCAVVRLHWSVSTATACNSIKSWRCSLLITWHHHCVVTRLFKLLIRSVWCRSDILGLLCFKCLCPMQMVLSLFWLHVNSVSSEFNSNRWAYKLIHATIQRVTVVV